MPSLSVSIISCPGPSAWALQLYDAGLRPIPCWGGGRFFPGTHLAELADNPPDREAVANADYRGGMSILCGTEHPAGGYTLGVDIDHGPGQLPSPLDCLYLEGGTAPGKWHIYLRVQDRLSGQINLRDTEGGLVAEVKGVARALRCWPTLPGGKLQGYQPLHLASLPIEGLPRFTARQVADGIADLLTRSLGEPATVEGQATARACGPLRPPPPGLAALVVAEIDRRGVALRPGRGGWLHGRCPLHDDRHPSFALNVELGAWRCFSGCGSGGLGSLALKLGMPVVFGHRPRRIPTFEVHL